MCLLPWPACFVRSVISEASKDLAGGNNNLSNVIDEEQYPGCVDLYHSSPLRREMECLHRHLDG